MMIEELKTYTESDMQDMDRLMRELSATSFSNEELMDAIVNDCNSHLYVLRNDSTLELCEAPETLKPAAGSIIGCACLCVAHSPEFTLGFVESVTVLSSYRGKGYGRMLMEHLMKEAKCLGVQKLHLTSNPRRIAANGLYQALGFKKYETNCYVMEMPALSLSKGKC